MQEVQVALRRLAKDELGLEIEPELVRTEEKFGDYSTNLAMKAGAKLGKNPRELAILLAGKLHEQPGLKKIEVAGPGFINITLQDDTLLAAALKATDLPKPLTGQEIVLEYTDPNPFKDFHIGHAYSNTVGVAIGKLLEAAGAKVHQVSYHGDVGLHIAMAIFGLKQPENKNDLGLSYAYGATAYKSDPSAKPEIDRINLQIYGKDDPEINQLYDDGRQRSLAEFEKTYAKLGVKFEKNYFESKTASEGMEIVNKNIGTTFEKSDGAIIFDGEKVGLHKRVFITKQGLPTYEAKEIGLAFAKQRDYPKADSFIVITANEIDDYFRVLVEAIKKVDEKLGGKIKHLSHGVVKFPGGKMSSRTGDVKLLASLLNDIKDNVKNVHKDDQDPERTAISAMKYEFIKHRVGSDFVFDVAGSISLQGNSGPYLQYAHARARAILAKAGKQDADSTDSLEPNERSLARTISHFPEVIVGATQDLMPSDIATYLYELAQRFNSFYEANRVVGDPRQAVRVKLVRAYADVLKSGLELLNIAAPDRV